MGGRWVNFLLKLEGEMNADQIMQNLKIVAMLGEQDKLTTGPRFGLRTPNLFRSIARRWNGENRENDIQNLRNLLSSAICIAELNESRVRDGGSSMGQNDRLVDAIADALGGMRTLTRTYHDDQETCARIELLIDECHHHINALRPGMLGASSLPVSSRTSSHVSSHAPSHTSLHASASPSERKTPTDTKNT